MSIPRTPLLYTVLGFMGGVVISRNAQPMSGASQGAIVLGMIVGGFVLWRAGYKGKSEAVAVAVATAVASANAAAEAHAQAVATQAVQIVVQGLDHRGIEASRVLMNDTNAAVEQAHEYIESSSIEAERNSNVSHAKA